MKSCLGHFYSRETIEASSALTVIPATCDWNVKFPGIIRDRAQRVQLMELPHAKESERSRKRWLEEGYELKKILEKISGRKLSLPVLCASIGKYAAAWETLGRLIAVRRERKISGISFLLIANAFMLDDVNAWTEKTETAVKALNNAPSSSYPGIFLAGSPISFPNLKVMKLIETAGMDAVADEMCTSERIISGLSIFDDFSEYGMLRALAEKYHLGCHCPSFADNDRRVENIMETMHAHEIKGLVYHVLKGCHPYDIECRLFEKTIKKNGFHFIKIETDYSSEDEKQILVRLEAFRELL